jgi:RNA polymerase sigma factor for flagellar operon FliA
MPNANAAIARTRPATTERDRLIVSHMDMTIKMARKMARRLPQTVSRDDVESAALLGLTEAATRYDFERGEPFMAFAAKRVRGAILDHLRKGDLLTRRARQSARQVNEVSRELESELGHAPSDAEIAAAMGMSEHKFASTCARAREATVIYLDDLRGEITHDGAGSDEVVDRQHRRSALVKALESLEKRQLMVLSLYYRDGLTLREIGAILGVTESRVCQIHTQALAALKEKL